MIRRIKIGRIQYHILNHLNKEEDPDKGALTRSQINRHISAEAGQLPTAVKFLIKNNYIVSSVKFSEMGPNAMLLTITKSGIAALKRYRKGFG